MEKIFLRVWVAVLCCIGQGAVAQTMIDLSAGTSLMDRFSINAAARYQVGERFRIGAELQYGAPRYRFIEAKPITAGYAAMVSMPLSVRLYQKDRLRLDFYGRAGLRFQGVIDPDENDARDTVLNSTAVMLDPGLIATVRLTEKLDLQSGLTVPVVFQVNPSGLFEALHGPLIYAGLSARVAENRVLFFKSQIGAAFGADGDTYKYTWGLQAGVRFALGSKPVSGFVEPTF
jgi:hypothetical protein